MARVQILYWKDIPAQIKVSEPGKRPIARQLPDSYQQRIDALAMKLGLHDSDAYLDQWQWGEAQEMEGMAEQVADQLIKKFEEEA
jgi:hypothetical protein